MSRYVVDEDVADQAWDYYVLDTYSENEPIGAFLDKESAHAYADWMSDKWEQFKGF